MGRKCYYKRNNLVALIYALFNYGRENAQVPIFRFVAIIIQTNYIYGIQFFSKYYLK